MTSPKMSKYLLHQPRHFFNGDVDCHLVGSADHPRLSQKLEFLATSDTLTELLNRRAFEESLQKYHSLSKRTQAPLSLIFFDIDDFKKINDQLGHHVGDQVLKRLAYLMKCNLRSDDLTARWGGEEFIVALINTDLKTAATVAEKLRKAIEKDPEMKRLTQHTITASFGISQCQADGSLNHAIIEADHAMYHAKQNGKNQITIAQSDQVELKNG